MVSACGPEELVVSCKPTDERSHQAWLEFEVGGVPIKQILPELEQEFYVYLSEEHGGSCTSPIVLDVRGVVLVPGGVCQFPSDGAYIGEYIFETVCAVDGSNLLQVEAQCPLGTLLGTASLQLSLKDKDGRRLSVNLIWDGEDAGASSVGDEKGRSVGEVYTSPQDDCGLRAEGCCRRPEPVDF